MHSKRRLILCLCTGMALLAMFVAPRAAGATVEVKISGFAYQPQEITVNRGDTISWTNNDSAPHTVTFDTIPVESDVLGQGEVFSHTFTTPGTFAYHCDLHPDMRANVTVGNTTNAFRLWLPFISI